MDIVSDIKTGGLYEYTKPSAGRCTGSTEYRELLGYKAVGANSTVAEQVEVA